MPVETGTYIDSLNVLNPVAADGLVDADNHMRLIKSTIKSTFPAIAGAVLPTHTELNFVDGVTSAIQTQLDAKATSASVALKADIASPTLTGIPAAPTAAPGTNTTQVSTTAFVAAAAALKADLASPTLTGTPAAPTAPAWTDTTQIATTAAVAATVRLVPENAQVGTTYTLVLADAGKMVSMSNAAAITLSVPTNASVAFPLNTRIDLLQLGAGQVSVSPTGITLQSSGSKLKITGQYSGATLWKKATDTWVLIGDIAT